MDFGRTAQAAKAQEQAQEQAPAPAASAPSDEQIAADAGKSTVDHGGHGGDGPGEGAHGESAHAEDGHEPHAAVKAANAPAAQGGRLAETGGDSSTTALAVGGAGVLAVGSATLLLAVRRRSARNRA
ncbi:hypothetical protein GCM10020000_02730 [Streptomyces olivoverticillatus]